MGSPPSPAAVAAATMPCPSARRKFWPDLQEQGALTSQGCAQSLGLSKEQTLRELRALLAQCLVTTHGKGPATRYTLP